MAVNDDMNTMPIRDLIAQVRERVRALPPEQLVITLVMNCMCNRLEQESDRADKFEKLHGQCKKLANRIERRRNECARDYQWAMARFDRAAEVVRWCMEHHAEELPVRFSQAVDEANERS